jgi:hypothetical protein
MGANRRATCKVRRCEVNLLYAVEKLLAGELEPGEYETETGEVITVGENSKRIEIYYPDGIIDVWVKRSIPDVIACNQ